MNKVPIVGGGGAPEWLGDFGDAEKFHATAKQSGVPASVMPALMMLMGSMSALAKKGPAAKEDLALLVIFLRAVLAKFEDGLAGDLSAERGATLKRYLDAIGKRVDPDTFLATDKSRN